MICVSISIGIVSLIIITDEGGNELNWTIDALISIVVFGSLIFMFQFASLWLFFKRQKGYKRVLYSSIAGIAIFILFMLIYGWTISLVRGFA